MNHRIRAAAIVVDDDRLLLVRHEIPEKGEVFWIPPGGGVEGEEETGVEVDLDRVAYVRQWIDSEHDYHHVEFFILAKSHTGEPSPGSDPEISLFTLMITDAKFLSQQEIQEVTVYPEMLKHSFWHDVADGFPQMKYLGVDKD
jgi:8-oxo-dGTP diphosphatase